MHVAECKWMQDLQMEACSLPVAQLCFVFGLLIGERDAADVEGDIWLFSEVTAHDAPGTIAAIAYAYVVSYLRLILPPTATDTKCEENASTMYAAKQKTRWHCG